MHERTQAEFRRLFAEIVNQVDEDIDLAKAALYIAGIEYHDLNVEHYVKTLDSLAEEASRYVNPEDDVSTKVGHLSKHLFVRQGFRGNEEDYYDPRNSYLNEVLDRRMGIPISLSLVYIEVARRLGIVFEGIGLPGHFVIRTGPPEHELYVDVFSNGEIMSRSDCEDIVRNLFHGRVEFQDEYLRPYTKREYLTRILTNLKHNHVRTEDYHRSISDADLIAVMNPSLGSNIKERATFHYSLKQYRLAIRDLESYLSTNPEEQDAEEVKRQIQGIWATLATLN